MRATRQPAAAGPPVTPPEPADLARLVIGPDVSMPLSAVTETFAILANRGKGKALAVDTPVPTPTGWTTMGALVPGDLVFGSDGRAKVVLGAWDVQQHRPCYEVVFDDGASIVADAEHLWVTDTLLSRMADSNARRYANRGRGGRPQCERFRVAELRTTEQVAATLRYGSRGDCNHSVNVAAALQLNEAVLPLDPYVLGAWLGDGTTTTAVITCADDAIVTRIRHAGYHLRAGERRGRATTWRIGAGPDGRKLNTVLREMGLLGNKHVPPAYLRASRDQRLALLAGLLDTDGWVQGGEAMVGFVKEELADAVHELVVGLGWKGRRSKKPTRLNGVDCAPSHQVRFRPDRQVFHLERKTLPLPTGQARRHRRRMIRDVRPVPSVPVRCITVEGDGMFLAGADMVPTHNSSTAHVLVEEFHRCSLPAVVLDVKGDWYGLRTSPDGTGPGLPFVIFGGDHGDLPLEPTAGEVLADVVVDERLSCVLDLSAMSKTRARSFATSFAEQLYRRNRQVLHLVVDEADVLVPQRATAETARLLGAMEDIGKRGRSRGLGLTLVTQRPQEVAKSVLDLCETVVLLGMTGPRSIKAVEDWVSVSVNVDETTTAREVIASLPSLPVGQAWVWSPGFLRTLTRTQVRRIRTYDSHSTPEPGAPAAQPIGRAPVDLQALGRRIATTAQTAERTDPQQLRHRIAQLEQQLAATPAPVEVRVDVPVLPPDTLAELRAAQQDWQEASDRLQQVWQDVARRLDTRQPAAAGSRPPDRATERAPARHAQPAGAAPEAASDSRDSAPGDVAGAAAPAATNGTLSLPKAQRAVLTALAQHGPRTSTQIALLTGYSHKSGGYRNALSALRSSGLIHGHGTLQATDAGLHALGEVDPLPTGRQLVDWWKREQLGKAERSVLDVLVERSPAAVSATELAAATGYSPTSGGFRNALSRLRSLELAHGRGELTVNPVLVEPQVEAGGTRG